MSASFLICSLEYFFHNESLLMNKSANYVTAVLLFTTKNDTHFTCEVKYSQVVNAADSKQRIASRMGSNPVRGQTLFP